jgi:hypothetical protein
MEKLINTAGAEHITLRMYLAGNGDYAINLL